MGRGDNNPVTSDLFCFLSQINGVSRVAGSNTRCDGDSSPGLVINDFHQSDLFVLAHVDELSNRAYRKQPMHAPLY